MPTETHQKDFWYKIEDSPYDEEEDGEDLRRIRSHVMNEVEEEEKEEKYKQLEFEFDEDLVAPI